MWREIQVVTVLIFPDRLDIDVSDVLGRASSLELAKPSLSKPKPSPDKGLQWARARLQISEAQAWGSSPGFDKYSINNF
jgi:hypothetical protein